MIDQPSISDKQKKGLSNAGTIAWIGSIIFIVCNLLLISDPELWAPGAGMLRKVVAAAIVLFSSFAGIAFLLMWRKMNEILVEDAKSPQPTYQKNNDPSFLYLAGAMLCWTLSAEIAYFYDPSSNWGFFLTRTFSTINTMFFLLALRDFDYQEEPQIQLGHQLIRLFSVPPFKWVTSSEPPYKIVVSAGSFALITGVLVLVFGPKPAISGVDIFFSTISLIALLFGVRQLFRERGVGRMNRLVWFAVSITFLYQFSALLPPGSLPNVISVIAIFYKVAFVSLFLILGFSWVNNIADQREKGLNEREESLREKARDLEQKAVRIKDLEETVREREELLRIKARDLEQNGNRIKALEKTVHQKEQEIEQKKQENEELVRDIEKLKDSAIHRIKNQLHILSNYIENRRNALAPDHPLRNDLDNLYNRIQTEKKMNEFLINNSILNKNGSEHLHLKEIMEEFLSLLKEKVHQSGEISFKPGIKLVEGQRRIPYHLASALFNLIVELTQNSLKHAFADQLSDQNKIELDIIYLEDESKIKIVFADNGKPLLGNFQEIFEVVQRRSWDDLDDAEGIGHGWRELLGYIRKYSMSFDYEKKIVDNHEWKQFIFEVNC